MKEERDGVSGREMVALEQLFDTLEAQLKAAPAGGGTPEPRSLTPGLEGLVNTIPEQSSDTTATRKSIALDYLALTREHYEKARTLRIAYVRMARAYGLTYEQIGDALGVTGAAVRMMLNRAEAA